MNLEKITVANNGFVMETANGDMYIAKTLLEAAQIVGEDVPSTSYTGYASGYSANHIYTVSRYFREGKKIEAIKLLRDCFTPRLGLREAKELVENMFG